jgi:hypothetical protein
MTDRQIKISFQKPGQQPLEKLHLEQPKLCKCRNSKLTTFYSSFDSRDLPKALGVTLTEMMQSYRTAFQTPCSSRYMMRQEQAIFF